MVKKSTTALLLMCITFFQYSCKNEPSKDYQEAKDAGFVYLEENQFMVNDTVFFPMLINYLVEFMSVEGEMIPVANIQYDSTTYHEGTTKVDYLTRLNTHFKYIKHLGFNTIRLVGLTGKEFAKDGNHLIKTYRPDGSFDLKPYPTIKQEYERAVVKIMELAKQNQLKVMILLPTPRLNEKENLARLSFIKDILSLFKTDNTVFSYDFFNEPLYFDNSESDDYKVRQRSKESAFELVNSWVKLMESIAPNQLSTIGFGEPIEVFEWDPSTFPLDFISFHTYHPLRVPNEIYWWSKYSNKPWMITETSLPADNDSISYLEQRQFMYEAYRRTINCGGSGFGWWQYQDVNWGTNFEHNNTSLLNHEGITYFNDSTDIIYGSPKAAALAVNELSSIKVTGKCDCFPNYSNMLGYQNIRITGKLIDGLSGEPIEGAVIRGWTNYWNIAANTFSDENGNFELYSNDEFIHFEISAMGYSKIKFDQRIRYNNREKNGSMFAALTNLSLEYHNIHYQPFLKQPVSDSLFSSDGMRDSSIVFDFDPELFGQYQFSGTMGIKMLLPLDFTDHE
jgi:hypothetical protein